MTTQPKTIDSPLLGATWVCFTREVAVEVLRLASEQVWGQDGPELLSETTTRSERYDQLADAVEAGTLDSIDAATWRGERGEAGE